MASIVSILKRKLALILPPTSANRELATGTIDDDDHNTHRPHKRQRHILLGDGGDDDDAGTATATSMSGTATPYLLSESARFPPPSKLLKQGNFAFSLNDYNFGKKSSSSSSSCTSSSHLILNLTHLPNDILSHCLYYIHTRSDRFGLQVSCKTLYHASNTDKMLAHLDLGGDVTAIAHHRGANNFYGEVNEDATGGALGNDDGNEEVDDDDPDAFVLVRRLQLLRHRGNIIGGNDEDDDVVDEGGVGNEGRLPVVHVGAAGAAQSTELLLPRARSIAGGLILDCDTSVSACTKLIKFAAAGNVQAMYMIAMILCYCHENIPEGVALLSHAAKSLHAPSMYALALILRDCRHTESNHYLDVAASLGYAPAWQEKLTPAEMRARFGDLDANALLQYMDPPCLNSLLGRHYLECSRVRRHQTSHCWNPLCGRWAFKALRVDGRGGGGDGDAAALRENIRANQIRLARLRAMLHEQNEMMNHRDIGEVAIRVARLRAMMHEINDIHRDIGEVNNEDGADHHQNEQLQRIRARHDILEPMNVSYRFVGLEFGDNGHRRQLPGQPLFSIEPLVTQLPNFSNRRGSADSSSSSSSFEPSPLNTLLEVLRNKPTSIGRGLKVSRMKMCSSCRRAKYCSKLCQVLDWRSGKHKMECQFL